MPIVWAHADGRVEVTQIVEDYLQSQRRGQEPIETTVLRVAAEIAEKAPHLKAATPTLVKSTDMPTDRAARAQWRLRDGKVTDGKVPPGDPIHPRPTRPDGPTGPPDRQR